MTDCLLALGSLAGLLVYTSIAVAIYRTCTSKVGDAAWHEHVGAALAVLGAFAGVLMLTIALTTAKANVAPALFGPIVGIPAVVWAAALIGTPACGQTFAKAALWPLAFPLGWLARALVAVVVLGARGPLKLGDAIYRRANRRVLTAAETAARQERIAAMEKELGL